jgi:hypothetical protein
MGEFLHANFGLPDGGLYSNIIASALLGVIGFVYGRTFERRSEQRHEDLKKHVSEEHENLKKHIIKVDKGDI